MLFRIKKEPNAVTKVAYFLKHLLSQASIISES
jgi:hypothetical protein